jgi:hypothetical protein
MSSNSHSDIAVTCGPLSRDISNRFNLQTGFTFEYYFFLPISWMEIIGRDGRRFPIQPD